MIARANHLRLVPKIAQPNKDVSDMATHLLDFAVRGEICGLFIGALWPDGSFVTDVGGRCVEKPTQALGMVSYLSDQIKELQHGMNPDKPR